MSSEHPMKNKMLTRTFQIVSARDPSGRIDFLVTSIIIKRS